MRTGLDPITDRSVSQLRLGRGLSVERPARLPIPYRTPYGLALQEGPQPPQLQYVGGLITDAVRYLNVEGDGRGVAAVDGIGRLSVPPDSSIGIWQACNFNYHNSAGAEDGNPASPPDGYNAGGSSNITISASQDRSKFGIWSFKNVTVASGATNVAQEATLSGTDAAGRVWTSSVWVYVVPGGALDGAAYTWKAQEIVGGSWNGNQGSTTGTFVGGWQRLVLTYTTIAANVENLNCQIDFTATSTGNTIYTDGWQLEPNAIATPYVESWPNNRLSRAAGYILGDAAVLTAAQGWVAVRIATSGWSSVDNPYSGLAPNIWNWGASSTNRIQLNYNVTDDAFKGSITSAGVAAAATTPALTFSRGDHHTLIIAWDGSNIMLSYNGAAFAKTAYTAAPTGLPAQWLLGARQDVIGQYADSDFYWMLAGTGTLTDADAATIHANGDTDPTTTPGSGTFLAKFDNAEWVVPGSVNTLTQSATARVSVTGTNVQPSVARVQASVAKTQSSVARVQVVGLTKTQAAVARIKRTLTLTQSAVARIQASLTKTQSATARVQATPSKTQAAIARIKTSPTATQAAIARVQASLTRTQASTARVQVTSTRTQTAVGRIQVTKTKTQPATARIAGGVAPPATDINVQRPYVSLWMHPF